ncbi:MAG: hypothetical protein QOH90_2208 [Actinomycetota bacterium]|jgi:uncharacterized RDD family membrane protein YckC|nr:hypothetical protein [Actinomycetota bacterium]
MSTSIRSMSYPLSATTEDVHVTGRRIASTFIDAVILGTAYNFLVVLFGGIQNPHAWEWNGTMGNVAANILYGIGVLLYFVLMEGYLGQTLGKMLAGIVVVREDNAGAPGIRRAVVRTALRIVDGLVGYALAFIVVMSSEKRQRLGDMAAHTLVVRKK